MRVDFSSVYLVVSGVRSYNEVGENWCIGVNSNLHKVHSG